MEKANVDFYVRYDERMKKAGFPFAKVVFSMLLVLALVICADWFNKRHSSRTQEIANTVFEEQIKVQHSLFKLNRHFNLKLLSVDRTYALPDIQRESSIQELFGTMENAGLSSTNLATIKNLKVYHNRFIDTEKFLTDGTDKALADYKLTLKHQLEEILTTIDDLEQNIFENGLESPKGIAKSKDINKLLLTVELVFVVVLGIVLQLILIFPVERAHR
ncbi:MAG: hypothetical protein WBG48_06770 [Pricia sp.]